MKGERWVVRAVRALVAVCLAPGLIAVTVLGQSSARATTAGIGWLADVNGRVTALGGAASSGDLGGVALRMPVIAVVGRPNGAGYWMAALDGGVFAFGGAPFDGSLGGARLNQPVVGMAATPSGRGYWLVAADGGVFAFGDAGFYGSSASTPTMTQVATIASTRTGRGYWLLDRAGGVHAFGEARLFGAAPAGNTLAVGIVATPSGSGYWIATADGAVHAFGDAGTLGSVDRSHAAIVGMATPWGSSSGIGLPLLEFLEALARNPTRPAIRTWVSTREVALTFDDGPSAYTPQVLSVLMRSHVPATFFAVGEQVDARPDLVRAETLAGMAVGSHSWDHADLTKLPPASIDTELRRSVDAIVAASGVRPVCFRPPYGSTNAAVIETGTRLAMTQILWNVDPSDYLRPGASTIAARVLNAATGRGLVIGIHDGGGDRSQTVAALPIIIDGLRARGYTFVRLC